MSRRIFPSSIYIGDGGGGPPGPQPDPLLFPYLPEAWLWAAQPGARDNLDPLDFVNWSGGGAAASASLGPSGEIVVQLGGFSREAGSFGSRTYAGVSWTFPGGPFAEGDKLSIVVQLDGADPQIGGPSLYICTGPGLGGAPPYFTSQVGARMDIPTFGQGGQLSGFVGEAGEVNEDGNLPSLPEMKTVSHSLPLLITFEALPGGETAVGLAPAYGQPLTGVHNGSAGAFEGAEKIRFYSYIAISGSGTITLHPATFRILGIKLDRA